MLVLFGAMWEPMVSAIVAGAALLLLGIFELWGRVTR
jgi:hypothetical protein